MILNKDITLINEYKGNYYGFFIRGVSFIGKTERTATERGLNSADYFTCRIPEDAPEGVYLTSKEWNVQPLRPSEYLTTEDNEVITTESGIPLETEGDIAWSLRPQKTYVVIGEVTLEELDNFKETLKNREVYTVIIIKDNRLGYPLISHWRFDCK